MRRNFRAQGTSAIGLRLVLTALSAYVGHSVTASQTASPAAGTVCGLRGSTFTISAKCRVPRLAVHGLEHRDAAEQCGQCYDTLADTDVLLRVSLGFPLVRWAAFM